jgi:hypothetical protein
MKENKGTICEILRMFSQKVNVTKIGHRTILCEGMKLRLRKLFHWNKSFELNDLEYSLKTVRF